MKVSFVAKGRKEGGIAFQASGDFTAMNLADATLTAIQFTKMTFGTAPETVDVCMRRNRKNVKGMR